MDSEGNVRPEVSQKEKEKPEQVRSWQAQEEGARGAVFVSVQGAAQGLGRQGVSLAIAP